MNATKTRAIGDTFWQGELCWPNDRIYREDMPERDTAEEALSDAANRLALLSDTERRYAWAQACQWRVTDIEDDGSMGGCESTGQCVEG